MADEPKAPEHSAGGDPPKDEPKIDRKLVETHPAFLGLKEQAAAAKAALEEMKAAQAKAAKEAEEKKLAEKNDWETLKKRTEDEISKLRADHERELLTLKADAALANAGLSHPVARDGYVSRYVSTDAATRPNLDDWIKSIREDESNAIFFKGAAPPIGGGPTGKASPAGGSLTAVEQVKVDLISKDPKIVAAARERVRQMIGAGQATAQTFLP